MTTSLNLPPLWTFTFIGIGWWLSHRFPLLPFHSPASAIVGLGIAILAIALIFWTAFALFRHSTTFIPHRQANHLVTSGPFRFSRHPIYLADLVILFSSGLMMGSIWPLLLIPFLTLVLRQVFIIPEEKMLRKEFPKEFQRWASSVRRWL